MSRNLQLHIPTPCHENWANMQPAEQGRHCAACQKTVVDFTSMTDHEIIHHIAQASSNVCGRFTPDQMNRNLAPLSPAQRNGGSGWRWLSTGLLITSNPPEPNRSTTPQLGEPKITQTTGMTDHPMVGKVAMIEQITRHVERLHKHTPTIMADTDHIVMGKIAATIQDSISGPTAPSLDTVISAKKMISCGPGLSGMAGGLVVTIRANRIDSIRQFITDTLTTLHLLPKKELAIYPNPARRGNPISLSWRSAEPDAYQVALFSSTGALIQEKVLQVTNPEQVDLLNIPSSVTTGIYILRAIRPGQSKPYTQQLLVE